MIDNRFVLNRILRALAGLLDLGSELFFNELIMGSMPVSSIGLDVKKAIFVASMLSPPLFK